MRILEFPHFTSINMQTHLQNVDKARLIKKLGFILILWTCHNVFSQNILYDIIGPMGPMGNARIVLHQEEMTISFEVTPLPFFRYKYTSTCKLEADGTTSREEMSSIMNGKTNAHNYIYRDGDVIRSNRRTLLKSNILIPNPYKPGHPSSIFVLLARCMKKNLLTDENPILIVGEKIGKTKIASPETGSYEIADDSNRYVICLPVALHRAS